MPPAVRKCQTFTTHHSPYQICRAHTNTHTRSARAHTVSTCTSQMHPDLHAQTHTCQHPLDTQHNGGNLISQRGVWHWFLLLSGLGGIWFGTVWLMLENPQQHHGLSRLHFLGSRETWGVKGSSFVPLLLLHPSTPMPTPLFLPLSLCWFIHMLLRFSHHGLMVAFIDLSWKWFEILWFIFVNIEYRDKWKKGVGGRVEVRNSTMAH